jgi:hypothetical protein
MGGIMRIAIFLITIIALAWSVYVGIEYAMLLTGSHWVAFLKMPVQMQATALISLLPILALDVSCVIMWRLMTARLALQP